LFTCHNTDLRDWIATIRCCVRDAEYDHQDEIQHQQQEQQEQQGMSKSGDVFPLHLPAAAPPLNINIPQLSSSDRIAAMVRGSSMYTHADPITVFEYMLPVHSLSSLLYHRVFLDSVLALSSSAQVQVWPLVWSSGATASAAVQRSFR
jgi:hypothetical protein